MSSPNLASIEIRAFVPAQDYKRSREFYEALGFICEFDTGELAGMRLGAATFLLQNFHVREHTGNFQMQLLVENADAWHALAAPVAAAFQVRIDSPEDREWGQRDFPLFDPSGVLWRIGQRLMQPSAA